MMGVLTLAAGYSPGEPSSVASNVATFSAVLAPSGLAWVVLDFYSSAGCMSFHSLSIS